MGVIRGRDTKSLVHSSLETPGTSVSRVYMGEDVP